MAEFASKTFRWRRSSRIVADRVQRIREAPQAHAAGYPACCGRVMFTGRPRQGPDQSGLMISALTPNRISKAGPAALWYACVCPFGSMSPGVGVPTLGFSAGLLIDNGLVASPSQFVDLVVAARCRWSASSSTAAGPCRPGCVWRASCSVWHGMSTMPSAPSTSFRRAERSTCISPPVCRSWLSSFC